MRLSYFVILFFVAPLMGYDFVRHTDNLDTSRFFDTTFINDHTAVQKALLEEEEFAEVFFPTSTGHVLHGLLRKVPNPDFSIIFCSGFIPGKPEGIATFVTMMPKNCNILFFNGHGKRKSTGLLSLLNLLNYGRYDYHDTIGAIEYANFIHDGPLFVYGICAGAFHAAHALVNLQENTNNKAKNYNIKGFISDSGWARVDQVAASMFDDKLAHEENAFTRAGLKAGRLFTTYVGSPLTRWYKHETSLHDKIGKLSLPILFIHSYDDALARIEPAQKLARAAQNAETWWIETPSRHACHHLKYKYEYAKRLADFISTQLEKDQR